MDANFGLVRKKSSGAALKEDHVANPFFCNQQDVDKFVTEMGTNNASKSKVNYMNWLTEIISPFSTDRLIHGLIKLLWNANFYKVTKNVRKTMNFLYRTAASSRHQAH